MPMMHQRHQIEWLGKCRKTTIQQILSSSANLPKSAKQKRRHASSWIFTGYQLVGRELGIADDSLRDKNTPEVRLGESTNSNDILKVIPLKCKLMTS
jgi:hypothetical protein